MNIHALHQCKKFDEISSNQWEEIIRPEIASLRSGVAPLPYINEMKLSLIIEYKMPHQIFVVSSKNIITFKFDIASFIKVTPQDLAAIKTKFENIQKLPNVRLELQLFPLYTGLLFLRGALKDYSIDSLKNIISEFKQNKNFKPCYSVEMIIGKNKCEYSKLCHLVNVWNQIFYKNLIHCPISEFMIEENSNDNCCIKKIKYKQFKELTL